MHSQPSCAPREDDDGGNEGGGPVPQGSAHSHALSLSTHRRTQPSHSPISQCYVSLCALHAAPHSLIVAASDPALDASTYALNKNDAWHVITAYFAEKGLVRQQLDSFDQFIENTMQEVVEESLPIDIYPDTPSTHLDNNTQRERHRLKFGQVYLSAPQMIEADGKIDTMLPNIARIRNLTYCAPLFVDVSYRNEVVSEVGEVVRVLKERKERVFLGRIPIMLHSSFCVLKDKVDKQLTDMKECVYDQGGYFVINGSEKVLIAQERMASNHVYIFSGQKKGSYQAEIRSMAEGSSRVNSVMYVKLVTAKKGNMIAGKVMRVSIPYIKKDIPIMIVFRALGFVRDRDILEHVVYDFSDSAMMELLNPSLEEGFVIHDQQVALDYIGKRGTTVGAKREARIKYAQQILTKEFLPHVSTEENSEVKKAYFFGYMIHKLLATVLGRRDFDDRDHYGNKRMDLAGPLLHGLFRQSFYKVLKEARLSLERTVQEGKGEPHTLSHPFTHCTSTNSNARCLSKWLRSNTRVIVRRLRAVRTQRSTSTWPSIRTPSHATSSMRWRRATGVPIDVATSRRACHKCCIG